MLIRQLWQTYANTLSLLGATFPIDRLPKLSYLLEEDDDTIGYLPFSQANGSTACNWDDESKEKAHPNDETLARILSLLEDGRLLCLEEVSVLPPSFLSLPSTHPTNQKAEYPNNHL